MGDVLGVGLVFVKGRLERLDLKQVGAAIGAEEMRMI